MYPWNGWLSLWWIVPTLMLLWFLFGIETPRRYAHHYRDRPDDWEERWRLLNRERKGARFRGRGPRNYRRSDDRILEDVSDRLLLDPDVDASDVDVLAENGKVTLSGSVASRFEKQLSELIADSVAGVFDVDNRLRIDGTAKAPALKQEQALSR